jgi:hypothetical protein
MITGNVSDVLAIDMTVAPRPSHFDWSFARLSLRNGRL